MKLSNAIKCHQETESNYEKNGYVKKAFAGKYRYVLLTELGKNAITNSIQRVQTFKYFVRVV